MLHALHYLAGAFSPVLTPLKAVWNWFKKTCSACKKTQAMQQKKWGQIWKGLAVIILKITDLIKKMFQLGAKVADFLSFGLLSKTDKHKKQ